MKNGIPILISILLAAFSSPASAQPCRQLDAGVVVGMEGGSRAFELVRRGGRIPIGFYTELRGEDRLRLLSPGELRVQRADGRIARAAARGQWFCIVAGKRLRWWDNAWQSFGELLTKVQDDVEDIITRDDTEFKVTPSDLAGGTAVVAAGSRRLALAWQGGRSPFAVTIAREGASPLVFEEDLKSRLLRTIAPRDIVPGRYRVEVRDVDGQVATGSFTASGSIKAVTTSDEAMGLAGELLTSQPSRSYEALLVLGPYRKESRAVRNLMEIVATLE